MRKEKWLQFWKALWHWPGWTSWLHWKGWTAWLHWKGWKAIASWGGWRKLFVLHPLLVCFLVAGSGAGLCWIFLTGRDSSLCAYPIYVFSFYALITALVRIPGVVKSGSRFVQTNRYTQRYLLDKNFKMQTSLYFEQVVNFFYGTVKIIYGALYASFWIGADGLYNLVQGSIQLVQILRRRKELTIVEQWKSYRLCGILMFLLHLTMTGLVFQMIYRNAFEEYPGYMIFVTALFAFYKIISSFIHVAKDRKHKVPIDSSVRLLNLSQALFSMFSLQVAMIHQFEGSEEFAMLMNTLTGGAVCLLVIGIGIYMLYRSRKAFIQLSQEIQEDGKREQI